MRFWNHTLTWVFFCKICCKFSEHLFLRTHLDGYFWKLTLKFIRRDPNSFFNIHDFQGIKFLTRLYWGLSHLNDHKFRHNFQDSINLIYSCGHDIETKTLVLLLCIHYNCARQTLFNKINNLDSNIFELNEFFITNVLPSGNKSVKSDIVYTLYSIMLDDNFFYYFTFSNFYYFSLLRNNI